MNNHLKKLNFEEHKYFYTLYKIFLTFSKKNIMVYAANTSFYLIFASIPLLALLFSTVSLVPNIDIEEISKELFVLIPNVPYIQTTVNYYIGIARGLTTKSFLSFNAVSLFFAASAISYSLTIAIKNIHNIKTSQNYIRLKLLSIINIILFMVIIILMFLVFLLGNVILRTVNNYFPIASEIVSTILSYKYLVSIIILFIFTISIYTACSEFRRTLKNNFIGAVIATFSFIIISNIFSLFFTYFPLNTKLYGSLVGVVIVMLWILTCITIIYIGAVINEVIYPKESQNFIKKQKNLIRKTISKKIIKNIKKTTKTISKLKNKTTNKPNNKQIKSASATNKTNHKTNSSIKSKSKAKK